MGNRKKYYAVRKGRSPGIYRTWEECRKNTNGFSGAEYKGFQTKEEAIEYMGKGSYANTMRINPKHDAVAYVDGSYNERTQEYSYGVVLFHCGVEQHFSEKMYNPKIAGMRNVAGEIEGAKKAMEFCFIHGIKRLTLFYDYEGIEKWCSGEWKARKPGTMEYRQYFSKIKENVDVHFVKVRAHSGIKYNELADLLAKRALGL